MLIRTCQSCNEQFVATNNNQKFCKKDCRNVKRICLNCNSEYYIYYKKDTKYCSDDCYHSYQSSHKKEYELYNIECKCCKTAFKSLKQNQEYCSRSCMYTARKQKSNELRNCLNCNKEFICYKKSKKSCCSIKCSLHHRPNQEKRIKGFEKVKDKYGVENIMQLPEFINKISDTKLRKYGDPNYNNLEKNMETCMQRYGIAYGVLKAKSNGIGISKPQQRLYDLIKEKYPNAVLEYYIPELKISADIYIPEKNLIVEFFGDYWHCNPAKYSGDYYHRYIHLSASDIWEKDKVRENNIKELGYDFQIIWESDFSNHATVDI